MKYIVFVIELFLCSILCSCDSWMNEHLGREIVHFENNADYEISVFSAIFSPYDISNWASYPDTNLPQQMPQIFTIEPKKYRVVIDTRNTLSGIYRTIQTDTISVFVISTEQGAVLNWDSIRTSYAILQRYDMCFSDFQSMRGDELTFPPTPAMRNIKMWPPYGTYNSLGHRN